VSPELNVNYLFCPPRDIIPAFNGHICGQSQDNQQLAGTYPAGIITSDKSDLAQALTCCWFAFTL